MAIYAIGDIHGCRQTLHDLLAHIGFSPQTDCLWLTGDLVNRGADSLGVLRWVYAERRCIKTVLGNHDLHLLATHLGAQPAADTPSLHPLLAAPDAALLCGWLRTQPLMIAEDDYVLLHAGRMPEWSMRQALELATEAAARIGDDDDFFSAMYGNEPRHWHPALSADSRHRLIINAFSRLRLLTADGGILPGYAAPPHQRPPGTVPWFDFENRQRWAATIICGHWSALGLLLRRDVAALDSGCLWGRTLTAMRLEDRQIFQVPTNAADMINTKKTTHETPPPPK